MSSETPSSEAPWDYVCPVCGQGGLHRVLLRDLGNAPAVLCEECDSLWLGEKFDPDQPHEQFEHYMEQLGLKGDWFRVEILN